MSAKRPDQAPGEGKAGRGRRAALRPGPQASPVSPFQVASGGRACWSPRPAAAPPRCGRAGRASRASRPAAWPSMPFSHSILRRGSISLLSPRSRGAPLGPGPLWPTIEGDFLPGRRSPAPSTQHPAEVTEQIVRAAVNRGAAACRRLLAARPPTRPIRRRFPISPVCPVCRRGGVGQGRDPELRAPFGEGPQNHGSLLPIVRWIRTEPHK